jgi:putative flippase GtrA
MRGWLVRNLPGLKKVAGQFTYMSFGSGLFFLVKIGWLYLTEQIGLAAWLSYLIINIALTVMSWTYHSKVTFKTGLSAQTAWRYINASIGLTLFDYLGFLLLTYAGHINPVISAIIMSAMTVGTRFFTYSTYVFCDRDRERGPVAASRLSFSNVILGIALLAGTVNYALAIDGAPPQKDGKQNYCAAANLYMFGVLGGGCEDPVISGSGPQPSMRREPGLPALLALTFAVDDGAGDVRACGSTSSDWCKTLRTHQRMILLLPFLALIVVVYFACNDITGNRLLAAAAALCGAFGTGLIESSLAFLTEPLAAVLLLLVAWMLYRIVKRWRPTVAGVVCGVALGLLALTKAIYFYFVPTLGLLALLALPVRSWRGAATGGLVTVVIAALISGLWIYRNHEHFGSNAIAGRDGNVMAIRAQFTTMTWRQYWVGYLSFTPKLGPKLVDLLGVDPDDAAMFDRDNPNGFYQHSRRGEGPVSLPKGGNQGEMRHQALVAFAEHWPMELALVPLTIYRSAFLPVGSHSDRGAQDPLLMRLVRLLSLALATAVALSMMPAFLLNVVVDLWRLNVARLAFHLPALFTVGVHSVMTHYIPRYNLPLFGVFAIELCLAASFLWTCLLGRRVPARIRRAAEGRSRA